MSNGAYALLLDRFLSPIVERLRNGASSCEVHWLYPTAPADNSSFPLPLQEAEHYLRSMMSDGFFVGVRMHPTRDGEHVQITVWEEWEGGFQGARWPDVPFSQISFEAVWSGFPRQSGM